MARENRFIALWAAHETRAKVWFRLFVLAIVALFLSLLTTLRVWSRPREVIRVGCDGIPQVVRIDEDVYAEPDQREIRAFAARFAVWFLRADSYSVVNDYVEAARLMAPELRERFKVEARRAVPLVEGLKRRTEIPAETLEVSVDKKAFPWRASVKGVRHVAAGDSTDARQETVSLDVELVRSERTLENPFGLLVWQVFARTDDVSTEPGGP